MTPESETQDVVSLGALRQAVADYMSSEGCSCCESDLHEGHEVALAKLLNVRKYEDDSGYNWGPYKTR